MIKTFIFNISYANATLNKERQLRTIDVFSNPVTLRPSLLITEISFTFVVMPEL